MRSLYSTILTLAVVSLASGLFAQESVPEALGKRFPNIRASLEDGFHALAEQQARAVLRGDPEPGEAREAALLLAHALWGQQRFEDMLEVLEQYNGEPGYVYWRARAQYELKRPEKALELLGAADEAMAGSQFAPAALRLKGHIERQAGRLEAAEQSFARFSERFASHSDATANLFDLAAVRAARGRVPEALEVYDALVAGTDPRAAQRARLQRARLLYSQGDADQLGAARGELMGLATNESTRLAYRIDAYLDLSALEDKAAAPAAANAALRGAIDLSPDARQRVPLKMTLAQRLSDAGDVAAALKLLEECRAEAPNETIAMELQLAKANGLLRAGRNQDAADAFQIFLDVADDPAGLARAWSGKGLALWRLERYAEAAVVFDKAEKALSAPADKAEALFKAGDSFYRAEQFEEAEKRYRAFGATYPTDARAPNAWYQLGLTLLKEGRLADALTVFDLLEKNHADTPFAEKAALRSADVLWTAQRWEEVLAKYARIAATYTNSPDAQALSEHQRGVALYTLGRYPAAQRAFETVLEKFPDCAHAPQATCMRGFSLFRQGHVAEGVKACEEFVAKYADSEWAPEVIFWLAEQHYNEGDYAEAEPLFLRVAEEFGADPHAPRALYWAGRCADEQDKYDIAIERYSRIVKTYPESDVMAATRFAQGDALTERGEFDWAILVFEKVIKDYPDSHLVNAAWGRKGDCQFTLAPKDPARYAESITSYQAILDSATAPPALKLQAEYKIGRTLEATGAVDKAFVRYMNVVYSFVNEGVERSPHALRWFTLAAKKAGELKEKEQEWVKAVAAYERLVKANAPSKEWAAERIKKIKADNWLTFQRAEESK